MNRLRSSLLLLAALQAIPTLSSSAEVKGFKLGLGFGGRVIGTSDNTKNVRNEVFNSFSTSALSFVTSFMHPLGHTVSLGLELNTTFPMTYAKTLVNRDKPEEYSRLYSGFTGGSHVLLGLNLNNTVLSAKAGYQMNKFMMDNTKNKHHQIYNDFKKSALLTHCFSWGFMLENAVTPHFVVGLSAMHDTGSGVTKHDGKTRTPAGKSDTKTRLHTWDFQVRAMYQF